MISFRSYAIFISGDIKVMDNKKMQILKDFIKQFLIILLYFLLNIILALPFLKVINTSNLANILISLILLIIFLFIFRKIIVPDFYDFKKNGKKYLKDTYYYYLIGVLIMIVSNYIINIFGGTAQNEVGNEELFKNLALYASLNAVIFAPIIEELMTRSILKNTFKNKYIYALFSGLIFGLLHVIFFLPNNIYELFYIIPYGALGFVFALIYAKSNNIITNITFHSLHNFICLILLLGSAL